MGVARIAVVGTGGIANSHLAAIRSAGERASVVAAVDVEQERVEAFRDKYDIPTAYVDVAEMLAAKKPDLVHVCTPPGTHTELSLQCMEAGAWVLCEKPLCGSLADLDRIGAVEERTGAYCSSVYQWRFGSGAQHLLELIRSGALGRLLVGVCQTTWYRDHAYFEVPWRGKWATELGGPTMGHGIHAMDLFLWLMGDWQEVSAMIGTLDRDIEVEDVSMATVRFASGALGSIVNSVLSPRQETYLRFDFQAATVELKGLYGYSNENWTYSIPDGGDESSLAGWRDIPTDIPSSHAAQVESMLDSLERGERPAASGEEARRTLEFITALYKSAATGERVTPGSIGPDDPFYNHVGGTLASPQGAPVS